jgi:hypothetical protein
MIFSAKLLAAQIIAATAVMGIQSSTGALAQGKPPEQTVPPAAVKAAMGGWQLSQEGSPNTCIIVLNEKPAPGGFTAGVPTSCKKSIKALLMISSWTIAPDGRIVLNTAKGDPVLTFDHKGPGKFTAKGPNDERFQFEQNGGRYEAGEKQRALDTALASVASPAANPKTPPELAGRYSILRGSATETGCVVMFEAKLGPKPGLGKAEMEKGCADKGLTTFDPAGWHLEVDRLFLTARKGHSMGFNKEKYGWNKDPAKGSPLILKKL